MTKTSNIVMRFLLTFAVAPCVGAWIEMISRGQDDNICRVAPCVGAWIEIFATVIHTGFCPRRSLRGSVD